jgi:hypothetical protein
VSFDWEAEIAGPALELDGVAAELIDSNDNVTPVTVIFSAPYIEINALGQNVESVQPMAIGARSALLVAKKGHRLRVNEQTYLIASKPQDDGRVWIKLPLEGPIDE